MPETPMGHDARECAMPQTDRDGRGRYFGLFTSTVGTVTSFFSVVAFWTLMVSFVVPTSTVGVCTVSVCVPTTGFCTSYSPSPVFLQAPVATSAARANTAVSLRTPTSGIETWNAETGTNGTLPISHPAPNLPVSCVTRRMCLPPRGRGTAAEGYQEPQRRQRQERRPPAKPRQLAQIERRARIVLQILPPRVHLGRRREKRHGIDRHRAGGGEGWIHADDRIGNELAHERRGRRADEIDGDGQRRQCRERGVPGPPARPERESEPEERDRRNEMPRAERGAALPVGVARDGEPECRCATQQGGRETALQHARPEHEAE